MDPDRLNEIEQWVVVVDNDTRNAGVRMPAGMVRELLDEVRRLALVEEAALELDELRRRLGLVEGLCRGWKEDFERHSRDITADTDAALWRAAECAEDIREVLRSDALSVEQEKQEGNHE